jgi:hypothetical protein
MSKIRVFQPSKVPIKIYLFTLHPYLMQNKYEGESISKVNLNIASTQPFWQLTVSDNITNFIRKLRILHVQMGAGLAQAVKCLTTGWTTGWSGFDPRQGQRIFPLSSVFRPALGPTQPPLQWVPGVLSPGVKRGRGVMLTTHPHLLPRSWISRSYNPLPPSASMACSGTALLLTFFNVV